MRRISSVLRARPMRSLISASSLIDASRNARSWSTNGRVRRRIRSPNPSPRFRQSPAIHYASRFVGGEKRTAGTFRRTGRRVPSKYRYQFSAHRFLHERADPCLFGGSQLLQREGDRPQGAFVEVRRVAEAERRVPRFELLRALEEADNLAVLGIRRHPVPGSGREGWRVGFDGRMKPLGHGTIRLPHLGDLREHGAFPVRLVRPRAASRGRLPLLEVLLHRGSFLVREARELLVDRGGARGGLLLVLLW